MSEIHVPQAVMIDYDRTLGDVEASFQRFMLTAAALDIEAAQITEARAKVENDGGSFAPFGIIEPLLAQATSPNAQSIETFAEKYVALNDPKLLYDDADPFLYMLDAWGTPHAIATYSVEQPWQALKVRASGIQSYCEFMSHPDKGLQIEQWRQPAGSFDFVSMHGDEAVAIYRAASVCLIDDKAKAFKSLPEDCSGYLLQRSETLLPSQQGAVPPNVKVIRSLGDLCIENGCLTLAESVAATTQDAMVNYPHRASVQYVPLGNVVNTTAT